MLERFEELKSWFHQLPLERRVRIIELWKDGEDDQLRELTGERYEQFEGLMEQTREIYLSDEMDDKLLQEELKKEGFESVIALTIVDSLEKPIGIQDDLTYINRSVDPTGLGRLVDCAIKLYTGRTSPDEVTHFLEERGEHIQADRGSAAQNLFERVNRLVQATIRISIKEAGGIEALKSEIQEQDNISEEHISAMFDTIEPELEELQRYFIYYRIITFDDKIDELNDKLETISVQISEYAHQSE